MLKESCYENLQKVFGGQPIYSASIKVSRKCNLACKHCYVNTDRSKEYANEISTDKIFNLIDQLSELGVMNLFLNGGEPLIHRDILKIYEYATKKGFRISMSTNGYNVDDELLNNISKFKPQLFQVSIDGIEDTHDKIRNTSGVFKAAYDTLKRAINIFNGTDTNVVMASTLMKDNINEIEQLYKLAYELGVNTYAVIPLMYTGKATNDMDVSLEEKYNLFNRLSDLYAKKYSSTELSLIVPPALVPSNLRKGKYGNGYLCTFPHMLGIDSDGKIAVCEGLLDISDMIIGNAKENSISELWNNNLVEKILRESSGELEGVCSKCNYLESCHGGCRANSYYKYGNFYSSDPMCEEFYSNGLFPRESLKPESINNS